MLKGAQFRQNVLMMLIGGALVALGATLSHHPAAIAIPPSSKADDLSAAFRQIAAEAVPSIVSIETVTKSKRVEGPVSASPFDDDSPFRQFFRNDPRLEEFFRNRSPRGMVTPQRQSMGSGFIIDSNGTVMTNGHVVRGADEVRVRLHDGREFVAKDVKMDPRTDVAILKIDATDLKPIRLGDSRAVEVGDWVLAIGSPFGLDMSVTAGIISAKGRSNRITERADFLQTDAAINPGNSGGPLISMKGEVIGINTAIATESGGYDGIGFAIPTHIAGWVSDQLLTAGEVKRGYLGTQIQAVDAKSAKQFNVKINEGVIVHSILPGSPAEKAGLEPGDVVLNLNGQRIESPSSLQGVVEQLTIGKSYPLEIIRDGQTQKLSVTIEQLPKDITVARRGEANQERPETRFDNFGLELRTLTKDLARQFGTSSTSGVIVTGVEEGSIADQSGIKPGDQIEKVGGQQVMSVEDYERVKSSFAGSEGLVLNIRSTNGRRFYVVLKGE